MKKRRKLATDAPPIGDRLLTLREAAEVLRLSSELENFVARCIALGSGPTLRDADGCLIPEEIGNNTLAETDTHRLDAMERYTIVKVLKETKGDKIAAARILGRRRVNNLQGTFGSIRLSLERSGTLNVPLVVPTRKAGWRPRLLSNLIHFFLVAAQRGP